MRWLVRFGYDGERFGGWARQPGRRTVEGTIRTGLERSGLARSVDATGLEVASRTDAGVSARANALGLRLDLPAETILRAFNGFAPDIFFTAARPIPEEFRVRRAEWREYRYYLPGDRARARRLRRITAELPALVDVRSFGRGIPAAEPALRPLTSIDVRHDGNGVRIDLRAPSFVWGMIRKIVAAVLECEQGHRSVASLVATARGEERASLPLAPADGLVLWEVHYPGPWPTRSNRPARRQLAHLTETRRRAETRQRTSEAVWDEVDARSANP